MTVRAAATVLASLVVGAVASLPASAGSEGTLVIRPGVGISKLRLGMTEAQVRRAMGRPTFVVRRRGAFGVQRVEFQYGLAAYTVRLAGRSGRLRAVRIGTTVTRERTPQRVGVGSTERSVVGAYGSLRCQPLRTQRHGSVLLVTTIQRECTLFAASGRRTIFTTDVQERMFEVITPAMWASRARVIEVSVAAPA